MVKRLMLILAFALLVGLVALPAFAEVQNVKVSGDMTFLGIARNYFETDIDDNFAEESHMASIIRLRVDVDLTENVSTTLRLLNERDWDAEAAAETDIAVDLASVTLKEFLYSPLTLIMGRQELHYGNDFIIGDPDRNNNSAAASTLYDRDLSARKAFDAVKAILNYDPLVIDLFWAKINENTITGTAAAGDREQDDIDLLGVNARYDIGGNWNAIGELYWFTKVDRNTTAAADKNALVIHNAGARYEANPKERLALQGELTYQFGKNVDSVTLQSVGHQAMAFQGIARYALDMKYSPVLMGIYSYYSGDRDGNDANSSRAWDPMYENQTAGHIANVLLDPSNLHVLNLKGSIVPLEDLTLALDCVFYRFAKNFYDTDTNITLWMPDHAATSFQAADATSAFVGTEIDGTLTYDYTEDVQLSLLGGIFIPGGAINSKTSKNINEVIASVKVKF